MFKKIWCCVVLPRGLFTPAKITVWLILPPVFKATENYNFLHDAKNFSIICM